MRNLIAQLSLLAAFTPLAGASIVSFPNNQVNSITTPCVNYAGFTCTTTANFDVNSLDTQNDGQNVSSLFLSAFNAWNPGGWTLDQGGDPGGTFNVTGSTTADAARAAQFAGGASGGLYITITLSGVNLPTCPMGDSCDVGWAQGLYDNYTLNPSGIVAPFYEMDILSCAGNNSIFCAPLYPYQYVDNHFYDAPKFTYQTPGSTQAFFDANVYLSVADYTTKTLTVYDGVSYDFSNSVAPEPADFVLFVSGLGAVVFLRRRWNA